MVLTAAVERERAALARERARDQRVRAETCGRGDASMHLGVAVLLEQTAARHEQMAEVADRFWERTTTSA